MNFSFWLSILLTAATAIGPNNAADAYDTIEGRSCFRSMDGMMKSMIDLRNKYSDLISISDIGESYLKNNEGRTDGKYKIPTDGYVIYALTITAPDKDSSLQSDDKGKMLVTSGVHAREWAPPELLARFIEMLVYGYDNDADITWILQRNEIHAILYVNPDGRYMAEKYPDLYWRKNMNPNNKCGDGDYGVDINRNLDFMWAHKDGASSNPCDGDYHGTSAESEPETKALTDYAKKLFPEGQRKNDPKGEMNNPFGEDITGMYIDIHSSGGYVYYPWGHDDSQSPDDEALQALGRKMSYFNDYLLWAGGQQDFLYAASGDTSDWMYAAMGVASLGFEIGDDFQQKCTSFENEVVPINLPALLFAAKTAQKPYTEIKGPDIMDLSVQNSNGQIKVSAEVSDSEMVNKIKDFKDFRTGDQKITKVELYLDVHPDDYKSGDTKWEMQPASRRLDSEHVKAFMERQTDCRMYDKKGKCKKAGGGGICKWSKTNRKCKARDTSTGNNVSSGNNDSIDCSLYKKRNKCNRALGGDVCSWAGDKCTAAVSESAVGGSSGGGNPFNSGEETVKMVINASSLSPGRHALFVQATDSDGYRGPVSSEFILVSQRALRGTKK